MSEEFAEVDDTLSLKLNKAYKDYASATINKETHTIKVNLDAGGFQKTFEDDFVSDFVAL